METQVKISMITVWNAKG